MTTGNEQILSEEDVRAFLRDNVPELNLLIKDYEFGSGEISKAMNAAINYWNEIPPSVLFYTLKDFPYHYHFLMATCGQLLMSAAHRYRRNELKYSAGGIAIDDQNKSQQYHDAGMSLWNQYREFVRTKKVERNMNNGWAQL